MLRNLYSNDENVAQKKLGFMQNYAYILAPLLYNSDTTDLTTLYNIDNLFLSKV